MRRRSPCPSATTTDRVPAWEDSTCCAYRDLVLEVAAPPADVDHQALGPASGSACHGRPCDTPCRSNSLSRNGDRGLRNNGTKSGGKRCYRWSQGCARGGVLTSSPASTSLIRGADQHRCIRIQSYRHFSFRCSSRADKAPCTPGRWAKDRRTSDLRSWGVKLMVLRGEPACRRSLPVRPSVLLMSASGGRPGPARWCGSGGCPGAWWGCDAGGGWLLRSAGKRTGRCWYRVTAV